MSGRKQRSPEPRRGSRKQAARPPALPLRLLSGVGALATRHPKPLFGCAGFVVLFSFVAANALWYQPGGHPAPFLATRDPDDPNRLAGYRPMRRAAPDDVTTFRIERAPDPSASPAPAVPPSTPPPAGSGPTAAPFPASDPRNTEANRQLLAQVQRELARRGLYDGAEDGVMGSRTAAAILFYQESAGLPQTGEATAELLAALKSEPKAAEPAPQPATPQPGAAHPQQVAAPLPRPSPAESGSRRDLARTATPATPVAPAKASGQARPMENAALHGDDPIAAAIRSAERNPVMTPPADIPTGSAKPVPFPAGPVAASELVLQIQKGLSNIAYTDVEVDGVAGAQTRAAIRRFEKHYRLPETGEPNEAVLKKLKAIGAL